MTRLAAISCRAAAAIENELRRFPLLETGGLLLGYSNEDGVSVLEATDCGYQNAVHESACCQYDYAYEEHLCTVLSELYHPPLDVVGLWHKHNSLSEIPFSHADEGLHQQLLAEYAHPCLSILLEKRGVADYRMRVFLLKTAGHMDVSLQTEFCPDTPCHARSMLFLE